MGAEVVPNVLSILVLPVWLVAHLAEQVGQLLRVARQHRREPEHRQVGEHVADHAQSSSSQGAWPSSGTVVTRAVWPAKP